MDNSQSRKSTTIALDEDLLAQAEAHGVDARRVAEEGLRHAIEVARSETWLRDNAEALLSANDWVDRNGLPLALYRKF